MGQDGGPRSDGWASLMERIVAGDPAAIFELLELHRPALEAMVRAILGSFGRRDLLGQPDEVDGLVLMSALVIADRAGGWRPGGAPPWVWCGRAIRSEVARAIGHRTTVHPVELVDPHERDADGPPGPVDDLLAPVVDHATLDGASGLAALTALAGRQPDVALLLEATHRVGSVRDVEVHIDYRLQKCSGDPSPAHTVAALHDLTAVNVRQIDRRMRVRLAALSAAEERIARIARLPWVDAVR